MSHTEYLIRTPLVVVTDQHCTAPRSGRECERPLPNHELVFIRRGTFVTRRGRRQAVADPTRVLHFHAGDEVSFRHPRDGGDDCTILEFTADALRDVLTRRDVRAVDRGTQAAANDGASATPELLLRLHRLRRALRGHSTCEDLRAMQAEDEALHLLDGVVAGARHGRAPRIRSPRAARPDTGRDLVEHAKFLLASAPGKPHALADLARATNTSLFHLARTFRERVGLPLHQYLLRIRLNTALWRLSEGEQHLSTLALELGFNSHSHFTSAFRRAFGTPPSAARRALSAALTGVEGESAPNGPEGPGQASMRACFETEGRCHCV